MIKSIEMRAAMITKFGAKLLRRVGLSALLAVLAWSTSLWIPVQATSAWASQPGAGNELPTFDSVFASPVATDQLIEAVDECLAASQTPSANYNSLVERGWMLVGQGGQPTPQIPFPADVYLAKARVILGASIVENKLVCRLIARAENADQIEAVRGAIMKKYSALPLDQYPGQDSLKSQMNGMSDRLIKSILVTDTSRFRVRSENIDDKLVVEILVVSKQ